MDDVDTRFNQEPKNTGFSNEEAYEEARILDLVQEPC